MHSSSEDDDMESPFPNDLSLQQVSQPRSEANLNTLPHHSRWHQEQKYELTSCAWTSQAFSDYQIQQMTASFVDQFGFNDEEFSEHDENIK